MFQNEADGYSADKINRIVVSILYDGDSFIGYKTRLIFLDGCYREKIYDTEKSLLSDKKYQQNNLIIKGDVYKNGVLVEHIETDVGAFGIHHEIVMNNKNEVLSHKKFDNSGRFIGGGIYENGQFVGTKEIRYTPDGVYETVFDKNYHLLLDKKIDIQKYTEPENKNLKEIVLETHVMSRKKNGAIYETVFDAKNQIIEEPKIIGIPKKQNGIPEIRPTETNTPKTPIKQQPCQNKIMLFIRNLLAKCKTK